jgi:hypothetical protein
MTEDEIKKGEALARAGGNDCAEWHSPDRLLALYAEIRRLRASLTEVRCCRLGALHRGPCERGALSEVSS